MPRPVVPIFCSPFAASRARSSADVVRQDQRAGLRDARGARRRPARRPTRARPSRATSACGDSTTPLPMKQSTFSRRMPEGMRCSTVFLPPITSVWPALWPPWKRTTPCARSVSQSTILPLPSSPHCVPMTTTFRRAHSSLHCLASALSGRSRNPVAGRAPAERLADVVVAPAARQHGAAHAVAVRVEHHAGVVVVAAQLGEVEARRHRAGLGQRAQRRRAPSAARRSSAASSRARSSTSAPP